MSSPIQLLDLSQARVRDVEGSGTTTLTINDFRHQIFNLSAARTCVLPSTGVKKGMKYRIESIGAFDLTIQSSDLNNKVKIQSSGVELIALQDTPTSNMHWYITGSQLISASSTSLIIKTSPTLDTWYDIAGLSIALSNAGHWDIVITAPLQLIMSSGQGLGKLALRDGLGNVIESGIGCGSNSAVAISAIQTITLVVPVVLADNDGGTFKLSYLATGVTGTPTVTSIAARGDLGILKIQARRIN